jgi:hypothetical protein
MTIGQNPPKDDRLFARFAIEFPDSPKIKPLSDKAFRAWVEMVCWSRRHMTDGFIAEQAFGTFGSPSARRELMSNDPTAPPSRRPRAATSCTTSSTTSRRAPRSRR